MEKYSLDNSNDRYSQRGVSSQKEDVHNAIKNSDKGIFPQAFCKVIEDYLGKDKDFCNVMHADGAGTKSSLAYVYYKETGDLSVFKGIAIDSIVMNIDDLLCVGIVDNFLVSSTIGRNSKYVGGEIIAKIIQSNEEIADQFAKWGIELIMTGGETADVGDLVRTLIVDTTVTSRVRKSEIITNENIKAGQVIVGLSSFGKSNYEEEYNSGIGSNGLTSARHDLLSSIYKTKYPESYDNKIPEHLVYCGKFQITDTVDTLPINIGKAILSPTRTYAPIMKEVFKRLKKYIGGIVHCSGGGQTKCLKFGKNVHYIKDNLFENVPFFELIKKTTNTSYQEMYKVFNMGHRMEIYIEEKYANEIVEISKSFGVDAKVVGYIKDSKDSEKNRLTIKSPEGFVEY